MGFKKFGDIEYPIPGVDTAMQVLRPNSRWSTTDTTLEEYEDDEGGQPPTWKEIEEEIKREFVIYNYYDYERKREKEYPDLISQLDLIYHDIKNNNLNNGSWIKKIDSIKKKYPKPEQ